MVKKLSFGLLVGLFAVCTVFGQSYLGWTNQAANLRDGPGTNHEIIKTLPAGTQLFIFSRDTKNNFYKVKDIETDTDGYISKPLIDLGETVEALGPEDSPFERTGELLTRNPEIKIYNNTDRTLTLTLNDDKYVFRSQETKMVIVPPGRYEYMASAPRAIPYYGVDTLKERVSYEWTFYIEIR
jgi:hypothetical protein